MSLPFRRWVKSFAWRSSSQLLCGSDAGRNVLQISPDRPFRAPRCISLGHCQHRSMRSFFALHFLVLLYFSIRILATSANPQKHEHWTLWYLCFSIMTLSNPIWASENSRFCWCATWMSPSCRMFIIVVWTLRPFPCWWLPHDVDLPSHPLVASVQRLRIKWSQLLASMCEQRSKKRRRSQPIPLIWQADKGDLGLGDVAGWPKPVMMPLEEKCGKKWLMKNPVEVEWLPKRQRNPNSKLEKLHNSAVRWKEIPWKSTGAGSTG